MNKTLTLTLLLTSLTASANAAETPLGKLIERDGMALGAVYLQPVLMEPNHSTPADKADIHLEADVHSISKINGFEEGAWIPYLTIAYTITQEGGWKKEGMLMPMVANDGPHYGDNITLNGPGKYHVTYRYDPPSKVGFMRHIDKETGVAEWWKPFSLDYDFAWIGSTGKKGGY